MVDLEKKFQNIILDTEVESSLKRKQPMKSHNQVNSPQIEAYNTSLPSCIRSNTGLFDAHTSLG